MYGAYTSRKVRTDIVVYLRIFLAIRISQATVSPRRTVN